MALEGWVGWHGQGKTFSAVAHVLAEWDRHGHAIWSNAILHGAVEAAVALSDPELLARTPIVHFETWDDLMALIEVAIARSLRVQVLVDEAGKFLSSRFYQRLDPRVLMVLQERRKVGRGLDLYWTAPSVDHVDKILRDVTQAVHVCRRIGGSEYSHDGGRRPRAIWVRTYRPNDVGKERRRPIARRLLPFSGSLAALYTTGVVSMGTPIAARVMQRPELRDAEGTTPATGMLARGGR